MTSTIRYPAPSTQPKVHRRLVRRVTAAAIAARALALTACCGASKLSPPSTDSATIDAADGTVQGPDGVTRAISPGVAPSAISSAKLAALLLSAMLVASPAVSRAEPAARVVPDYTVFVDPPTGFVFVKLPAGWKFVGKVEPRDLARVPAGVATALLGGEDDGLPADRLASRPGK